MTIQEFRDIPALARRIERDREQLIYLQEKATSVPSTAYGRERVQNTVQNRAGQYSDAAVDLEREIEAKEAELAEMKAAVEPLIDAVEDDIERRILKARYLRTYDWEVVADMTGYTLRRCTQIERKALLKLVN